MVHPSASPSRRQFLIHLGALGAGSFFVPRSLLASAAQDAEAVRLGNGEHLYEWIPGWGKLPEGMQYGNTHGCIVSDSKGRIYVNTDTEHAVIVFEPDGTFVKSWGKEFRGGLHGMCVFRDGDEEFVYVTHHAAHKVAKCTLDGKVLWSAGYPAKAGMYESEKRFRPTSVAVRPDGGTSWPTATVSPGCTSTTQRASAFAPSVAAEPSRAR